MNVSVVICTYNRADGLRETLECLRRQRFRDFEVVVVNGPSTDHTEDVLASYVDEIKIVRNPQANLAVSRNIGIRASAGDIVAFIDDDALPETCWLSQALPAFDDDEVGGVGGIVLDHTGMRLQYRYSAANRFGEPAFSNDAPFDEWSVPGSFTFPYLQGTNSLFRRSALARVGLFDETFDFYLDETDLCCRIVDAGYQLRQLPNAPVHHKYLPSAVRNHARVITNWYPVVKNRTYFGYRHALHERTELDVIDDARAFIDRHLDDTRMHVGLGNLPDDQLDRAIRTCGEALAEGIRLGRAGHDRPIDQVVLHADRFLKYPTVSRDSHHRIVLVSSGYTPNVTGGIARFISDVAPELAALGHEVRVMTASKLHSTVDLEDGVWVHRLVPSVGKGRVPEASPAVDGFASAVADELIRISDWWKPDVAYGSLWDVELIGVLRDGVVPIVPLLATPVGEVATHEGWDRVESPSYDAVAQLMELEREVVGGSVAVHAISNAIVSTFDRLYPAALDSTRTLVAHIGRADAAHDVTATTPTVPPSVLFVGRLEARKGIDVLLSAIPPVLEAHPATKFVIAGADRISNDGSTHAQRWQTDHPNEGRVTFVGEVDDVRLAGLMAEASIVLMPSRYESFGLVVVEAMIHARPVVASAVGGIIELIQDGQTGVLVDAGDPVGLARAICDLLGDPSAAEEIGRRGRVFFEEHLSVSAAARRLDRVLSTSIELSAATDIATKASTGRR
jgi:glycogen synthase